MRRFYDAQCEKASYLSDRWGGKRNGVYYTSNTSTFWINNFLLN